MLLFLFVVLCFSSFPRPLPFFCRNAPFFSRCDWHRSGDDGGGGGGVVVDELGGVCGDDDDNHNNNHNVDRDIHDQDHVHELDDYDCDTYFYQL